MSGNVVQFIHVADLKDPDDSQGRTYRQVNAAKTHAIPIGALVELVFEDDEFVGEMDCRGVRLYVVYHARDCDQTPLYCLAWNKHDTNKEEQNFYNRTWLNGVDEESLKVITLPDRL